MNETKKGTTGDGPLLPLSAKGLDPVLADDFGCDYVGCVERAVSYLFFGPQFCAGHRSAFGVSDA